MPELTLYFKPSCPYCSKVKTFMRENKISIQEKDISADPQNREDLIRIGGKQQVPCLVIEGTALYESDAIIQWFKDNWDAK